MRPIWRGNLEISLVTIPVQMYTAHTSRKDVKFDVFHERCKSKIIEQSFCPGCEMTIGVDELVKGFESENGEYIFISDDDLEAARKEAIGKIEVLKFVDGSQINPIYYCHAHYLTPKRGKSATDAFALFRQAMIDEKKIALARVIIRNKEHLLAIRPHEGTLAAFSLHHPEEIRSTQEMEEAETVKAAKLDKQNLILAKDLIHKTTGQFIPDEFSGDYSKTLMEIIQAKAQGGAASAKLREKVTSLQDALEKSIERVSQGKGKTTQSSKRGPKKKAV